MKTWIAGLSILSSATLAQAADPVKCYQAEIAGVIEIVQTPAATEKPIEKPTEGKVDCKATPDAEECKSTDPIDDGMSTRSEMPRRNSDIFDDDRYSDREEKKTDKDKVEPKPVVPTGVTQKARTFSLIEDLVANTLEFSAAAGSLKFAASYAGKWVKGEGPAATLNKGKKSRRYAAEFSEGKNVIVREIADSGKIAIELPAGSVPQGDADVKEGDKLEIKTAKTIVMAPVRCR